MLVHQIITWVYQAIIGFSCLLLVVKIVKSKSFEQQLLAGIVLVPFALRLFLIK